MNKFKIDARDKKIGKVATEAAGILIGKNDVNFSKNTIADAEVEIINASKMDISEKKKEDMYFTTYSGYPGGQIKEKLGDLSKRRGMAEVLKRVVMGMLPKNKLRSKMILKLKITE